MRHLKLAFRCLVSLALIWFIARKINYHDLGSILNRIDWRWALLGSVLTFGMIAGLAYRWRIFLALQAIPVSLGRVIALTWAGQCFNSLLPGSTGGDVFKIVQACRLAPERKAAAAGTVLLDRISALIALVALAGVGFLLEPEPIYALVARNAPSWSGRRILGLMFIAGAGVLLAGYVFRANPWLGRLRRTLVAMFTGLKLSAPVVLAFALAFAIHLLNFLVVYFFARSLHLQISYGQVLLMMPVVLLLVMLPVTINGHGLRELMLVAYFTQMQISVGNRPDANYQDAAVALSILMVVNDLLWSLPGGVHYLTRFRSTGVGELAPRPA